MITLSIYGNVPSKKSNQIMIPELHKLIPSAKYRQYKNDFGRQLTGDKKGQFQKEDKLGIKMKLYFDSRLTVRDNVNAEQSVWDCLEDFGVIHNDAQFYENHCSKDLDKLNPRVDIDIWKLGDK